MYKQMQATLVNGMLKLDESLPLPDDTRVLVTVETIPEPRDSMAAWESLLKRLEERPVDSGGLHYTRDELHERR